MFVPTYVGLFPVLRGSVPILAPVFRHPVVINSLEHFAFPPTEQ